MSFVKHIFNREMVGEIQIADVQKLVVDKIEESLHLEFERIPTTNVKYDGLARHVSGFLNSSGGVVVFGLSEKKEGGRTVAENITWTTIKKEAVESSMFNRVDPWCEDIQILPLQNPNDQSQRIFIVSAPKSKNPPHMADHIYYTRLNFQTQQMGHEEVSNIFRQHYLQKYDLVNTVYGPLYNELSDYYSRDEMVEWRIVEYERIMKEKLYLLSQDSELELEISGFYWKVEKWNMAVHQARYRLASLINDFASAFFKKQLITTPDRSAVSLEIKSESTAMLPCIDDAILNRKDPVDHWKGHHPFDRILEKRYSILTYNRDSQRREVIEEKQFEEFIERLKGEVSKDELVQFVWKEFDELQSRIETLFDLLETRMG